MHGVSVHTVALAVVVVVRRLFIFSAAERARAAAMAFSKLSGDEQGIILGQLRNALEPRLVMYFSSANKELRALLPPAARQQLRGPKLQRRRSAGGPLVAELARD